MDYLPPVSVAEVVATSADALLSAARLHMGDALPDGRKLEHPDPDQAWYALIAASGMLAQLQPMLADGFRQRFEQVLAEQLDRFARTWPDREVPLPGMHAKAAPLR